MKSILFLSLLMIYGSSAAYATCTISAPRHRDLAEGRNKEVLCETAIEALTQARGFTPKYNLFLTVIDQEWTSVKMRYSFITPDGRVSGKGTEYWNPDGAKFVVEN